MPVVIVHEGPTLTRDSYEAIVRKLTGGKRSRMESASDWPVDGLLMHAAGEGESGFRVVDVWESEEKLDRFVEKLQPVLEEVGVTETPEVYQTHAFVSR
jgi:hypothetical protein